MTRKKDATFFLRIGIPLFFILAIVGYTYFRTKDLIEGVTIVVAEPKNNSTVTDSAIDIEGTITKSSAVFLNDRKIFLSENGGFKEKLLLSPGYNIITIRAEDKFERKTEKKLELVYKL